MSMKRLAILAFLAACIIVPEAMAQKNEVAGILGRTFISDQTITGSTLTDNKLRFGDGLTLEGNYARHLMGSRLHTEGHKNTTNTRHCLRRRKCISRISQCHRSRKTTRANRTSHPG